MHKMHEETLVGGGDAGATILSIGSRATSGDMNGNGLAITILTPVSSSTSNGSSQILLGSRPQNGHHQSVQQQQQHQNNMFSLTGIGIGTNTTTTIIGHHNHHNNNNVIGASSTTPNISQTLENVNNINNNHCNVITTTSSHQQQQNQQQCATTNIGMTTTLVEQSAATTTTTSTTSSASVVNVNLSPVIVVASVVDGNASGGAGDSTSLLSNADQSYSSAESLEIDIGDAAFDDTSESGYPDNSSAQQSQLQVGGGGGAGGYLPILPPAGGVGNPCDQTDLKYYMEELCPVCGDKVSGYHYGLLTCESCKGFFKRTVQNKKVYTCVAERQCHIDKTQRKRCPFCRFQKCLEVGMKLEAVRADRMRGGRNKFGPMYKRDRARKLQIMRQRQIALQTLQAAEGGGGVGGGGGGGNQLQLSPSGYPQSYSHTNVKQEIQIPQISSLTSSSPDSSPSPIAIALGQVSASGATTALTLSGAGVGGSSSSSIGSTNIPSTTSTAAVQNTVTDSKQWFANSTTATPHHSLSPKQFSFDTGTNPTSTADSGTGEPLSKKQNWKNSKSLNFPRVSPMIREFVQSVDDREWQQQLYSLLQNQSYNQCEVDLFELMCKVLDQNLFSQVDWARNTVFFKDLKVDDQMKLLQNSWSDMLVLDHLHQRIHNSLPDETTLHNGQKFDLLGLGLLGVPQLSDHFNELQNKLQELKFDVGDYICMKFLLLLNPDFADVRGITNKKTVLEGYENVQAALLDYTLTCYPSVTEKFSKLISIIPEIHAMAARGEEHLYLKHCAGSAPTQTLLMEMLHAKRK